MYLVPLRERVGVDVIVDQHELHPEAFHRVDCIRHVQRRLRRWLTHASQRLVRGHDVQHGRAVGHARRVVVTRFNPEVRHEAVQVLRRVLSAVRRGVAHLPVHVNVAAHPRVLGRVFRGRCPHQVDNPVPRNRVPRCREAAVRAGGRRVFRVHEELHDVHVPPSLRKAPLVRVQPALHLTAHAAR
eukprot:265635-Rhodomonas_salina.3